ncbi:hypothetical protein NQZ68_016780 [Dissostichus eleginoides]|nr:hypothetical protein NQZ68_016780 [Dissostichus eleginoides]
MAEALVLSAFSGEEMDTEKAEKKGDRKEKGAQKSKRIIRAPIDSEDSEPEQEKCGEIEEEQKKEVRKEAKSMKEHKKRRKREAKERGQLEKQIASQQLKESLVTKQKPVDNEKPTIKESKGPQKKVQKQEESSQEALQSVGGRIKKSSSREKAQADLRKLPSCEDLMEWVKEVLSTTSPSTQWADLDLDCILDTVKKENVQKATEEKRIEIPRMENLVANKKQRDSYICFGSRPRLVS